MHSFPRMNSFDFSLSLNRIVEQIQSSSYINIPTTKSKYVQYCNKVRLLIDLKSLKMSTYLPQPKLVMDQNSLIRHSQEQKSFRNQQFHHSLSLYFYVAKYGNECGSKAYGAKQFQKIFQRYNLAIINIRIDCAILVFCNFLEIFNTVVYKKCFRLVKAIFNV